MRRQTNPETAFTLTEVLISLFVLSVGILGVMSLFPAGLDATTRTLDSTNASILIQSALAELRSRQEVMEDFEDNGDTTATDVSSYPGAGHTFHFMWFYPGPDPGPYPSPEQTFRFTGNPSYSWNAVFAVPDTSTYFTVGGNPTYGIALVQVALYRDHDTTRFTTGSTATFADGDDEVTFTSSLSDSVRPGFYIREDVTGFWYRIAGISTDTDPDPDVVRGRATLAQAFLDPHGIAAANFTCTSQVVAVEATCLAKH